MHDNDKVFDILIVGAGASGMMAALAASAKGADVALIESGERVGTKILKTGNGRCNLSHIPITGDEYSGGNTDRIKLFLDKFGTTETLSFFRQFGLLTREKDGYIYPYSESASSVLDILRLNIRDMGIQVHASHKAVRILREGDCFIVECRITGSFENNKTDKRKLRARRVIISTGGSADPATGSDGNGFKLAKELGLKVNKPLPALTKLTVSDRDMSYLAGVRAKGRAGVFINRSSDTLDRNEPDHEDSGEIQFTKDALSGIPIFNVSRHVSRALDKKLSVKVCLDLMPDMESNDLKKYISSCISAHACKTDENPEIMSAYDLLCGIANKKINSYIFKKTGIDQNTPIDRLSEDMIGKYADTLKNMSFDITGTYGFEQAQVTCGGVDLGEVSDDLECEGHPGLYLTGEILDVDGPCGGYNLQWAWTSGYVAAAHAVSSL